MDKRIRLSRPAPALAAAFAAALLTACATASAPQPIQAEVELRATQQPQPNPDAPVTGKLYFKPWLDQVVITGQVENLPIPDRGWILRGRALHIHDVGDCSAPDPASAGGIFNPTGAPHSFPGSGMIGDLPMLEPNPDGKATVDYLSPRIKLSGPNSVIGKTVIVHQNTDNWAIQPDGLAGPAIACGVIRAVTPSK